MKSADSQSKSQTLDLHVFPTQFCHFDPKGILKCKTDRLLVEALLEKVGYTEIKYLDKGVDGLVFSVVKQDDAFQNREKVVKVTFHEDETELGDQMDKAKIMQKHNDEAVRDMPKRAYLLFRKFKVSIGMDSSDQRFIYGIETSKGENAVEIIKDSDLSLRKRYCCSLLQDLFRLHKNLKVHVDIKMSNFLFFDTEAILIDYGEAFEVPVGLMKADSIKFKGVIKGTPKYLAPELDRLYQGMRQTGNATDIVYDPFKADIYSLGLVMLEIMHIGLPTEQKVSALLASSPKNPDELLKFAKAYPLYLVIPYTHTSTTFIKKVNVLQHMLEPEPSKRWGLIKILMRINMMQKHNYLISKEKKMIQAEDSGHLKESVYGINYKTLPDGRGRLSSRRRVLYEGQLLNYKPEGEGVLTFLDRNDLKYYYSGNFWKGMLHGLGEVKIKDDRGSYLIMNGFWNNNIFCEAVEDMFLVDGPTRLCSYNKDQVTLSFFNKIYILPCEKIDDRKLFSERNLSPGSLMLNIWDSDGEFKLNLSFLIEEQLKNSDKKAEELTEIKLRRRVGEGNKIYISLVLRRAQIKKKIIFLSIFDDMQAELQLICIIINQLGQIFKEQIKSIKLKLSLKRNYLTDLIIDNFITNLFKISQKFRVFSICLQNARVAEVSPGLWAKILKTPGLGEVDISGSDISDDVFRNEFLKSGIWNLFKTRQFFKIPKIKCFRLSRVSKASYEEFLAIYMDHFIKNKYKALHLSHVDTIKPNLLFKKLNSLELTKLTIAHSKIFGSCYSLPDSLRKLDLSFSDAPDHLISGGNFRRLQVLRLKGCYNLSREAILEFTNECKETLSILDLSETDCKFEDTCIFLDFKGIRELRVANLRSVNEKEKRLVRNEKHDYILGKNLRILDLSGSKICGCSFLQNMFTNLPELPQLHELYLDDCSYISKVTIIFMLFESQTLKCSLRTLSLKNIDLEFSVLIEMVVQDRLTCSLPLALEKLVWIFRLLEVNLEEKEEIYLKALNSIFFLNLEALEVNDNVAEFIGLRQAKLKRLIKLNKSYKEFRIKPQDFLEIENSIEENPLHQMNDEVAEVFIKDKNYEDTDYELTSGKTELPNCAWLWRFPKFFTNLQRIVIIGGQVLDSEFVPRLFKTTICETLETLITGDCWSSEAKIRLDRMALRNHFEGKVFRLAFFEDVSCTQLEKFQARNNCPLRSFWTMENSQAEATSCMVEIVLEGT